MATAYSTKSARNTPPATPERTARPVSPSVTSRAAATKTSRREEANREERDHDVEAPGDGGLGLRRRVGRVTTHSVGGEGTGPDQPEGESSRQEADPARTGTGPQRHRRPQEEQARDHEIGPLYPVGTAEGQRADRLPAANPIHGAGPLPLRKRRRTTGHRQGRQTRTAAAERSCPPHDPPIAKVDMQFRVRTSTVMSLSLRSRRGQKLARGRELKKEVPALAGVGGGGCDS